MQSLFENCTGVILSSPYLLERASFHLPRGISYFLLYLALETRNHHAVRKLVEKWPHSDLTLNFLSSPLCRSHRSTTPQCLEPHEYGGVFGSYARYSCNQNVSSLLKGVFYNMYFYSRIPGGSIGLRGLDMSDVVVNVQQGKVICNGTCFPSSILNSLVPTLFTSVGRIVMQVGLHTGFFNDCCLG